MADNSNGWHFKHGLDADFMGKLRLLAEQGGWFADVLADPDLILGIRNNYMNVYWHGQSLFKIWNGRDGTLKFSTHPKYLVNPGLSKAVMFTGSDFQVGGHEALTTHYSGSETLNQMKHTVRLYVGDEKLGVHAVIRANPNVIDTEVTFNSEAEEDDDRLTQRIDLADFEEDNGKIVLRFWEAKLYDNPELRAEGNTDAPVVGQVKRYRKLVQNHRDEIVNSYRVVAGNLAQLASWAVPPRKVGELIEKVAIDKKTFVIDDPPFVGLAVYNYDAADKASKIWATRIDKLNKAEGIFVQSAGDAKNIKLRWAHSG